LKWTDVNTAGEPPGVYEEIAAYDPNTQRVLIGYPNSGGWFSLWSYDPSTNGYVPLNQADQATSYGTSGVIDPDRKLFLVVGNGRFLAVDISGKDSAYNAVDWSAQVASCGAMIAQPDPGLAYDAAQKLVVAWNGGNSVYLFNPETKSCTTQTFPGGPPAPTGGGGPTGQMAAGTFGRFRYFPKLNVFAVVNDVDQNGFVLRLSTGEPPVGTDAGADPLDADMGSPDVGHSVPPRGCGCSLYQASPTPGWWIVGAAAALLAWSRRRRRELRGAMGWLHTTIGKAPKIRLK
jgi:MYXO-CTERM domain-containing protein